MSVVSGVPQGEEESENSCIFYAWRGGEKKCYLKKKKSQDLYFKEAVHLFQLEGDRRRALLLGDAQYCSGSGLFFPAHQS